MNQFNPGNIEINEDGSIGSIDSINEKFVKQGIHVVKASELKPANLVPMGPFVMDYACFGGAPDHAPFMLHGQKSSGKSTISLHHIKELQIKYPKKSILYGAIERGSFQSDWARSIGIDMDRLIVTPENIQYGEEFAMVLEEAILTNSLSGIIVDSMPELLPQEDVERSADEESRMGANTRMVNLVIKKYNSAITKLKKIQRYFEVNPQKKIQFQAHIPSIVSINQRRDLIGARYPTASLPGGKRLQHWQLMTMELKASQVDHEKTDGSEDAVSSNDLLKSTHAFNLGGGNNKNKATGRLIPTGEFDISISNQHPRVGKGQIDDHMTVVKTAKRYGFVGGAGVGQTMSVYPELKFKNMDHMRDKLLEDEDKYWLLRACIIAKARLLHGGETMGIVPPDGYLQRCKESEIMEVFERVAYEKLNS